MSKVNCHGGAAAQIETTLSDESPGLMQDLDLLLTESFKMKLHLWLQTLAWVTRVQALACLFGSSSTSDQKRSWRGLRPRPRRAISHFFSPSSPICLLNQVIESHEPSVSRRRS